VDSPQPSRLEPGAGKHLDEAKYVQLLTYYYEKRGWDERGIPTRETMVRLGLGKEVEESKHVGPT